MRLSFLLSSFLVLSSLGQAAAQTSPAPSITAALPTEGATPYTIERDSLWQRAARVRVRTQARIGMFKQSSLAVRGTRHKIESYATLRTTPVSHTVRYALVKREISKHKTSGADIEKRFYYGLAGRLLLAEYYEQHQLVRLELYEYPMRTGGEYGTVFRETQWLRGDYLHLTTYEQEGRGRKAHHFYTEDHTPR